MINSINDFIRAQTRKPSAAPSLIQNVRKAVAHWLVPEAFNGAPFAQKTAHDEIPVLRTAVRMPRPDWTQIAVKASKTFVPGLAFQDAGGPTAIVTKGGRDEEINASDATDLGEQLKERFRSGWKLTSVNQKAADSSVLPMATGSRRVFQSMKAMKLIASQMMVATYGGKGLPDRRFVVQARRPMDVVLIQAYSGSVNCFPNAPTEDGGIPGVAFSFDAAGTIDWPTINSGVDMSMAWLIEPSVLSHTPPLPEGYDPIPKIMTVQVRAALFGPSLR